MFIGLCLQYWSLFLCQQIFCPWAQTLKEQCHLVCIDFSVHPNLKNYGCSSFSSFSIQCSRFTRRIHKLYAKISGVTTMGSDRENLGAPTPKSLPKVREMSFQRVYRFKNFPGEPWICAFRTSTRGGPSKILNREFPDITTYVTMPLAKICIVLYCRGLWESILGTEQFPKFCYVQKRCAPGDTALLIPLFVWSLHPSLTVSVRYMEHNQGHMLHHGGSKTYMPKKVPNIQRIINH
jgi:hypothetical protein